MHALSLTRTGRHRWVASGSAREFESYGNGKTGPNTFIVVKDRQKTKHATFEFIELGLVRKDGRLDERGDCQPKTGAGVEQEMGAPATPHPQNRTRHEFVPPSSKSQAADG